VCMQPDSMAGSRGRIWVVHTSQKELNLTINFYKNENHLQIHLIGVDGGGRQHSIVHVNLIWTICCVSLAVSRGRDSTVAPVDISFFVSGMLL